jgi:HK97 family phage portal protein
VSALTTVLRAPAAAAALFGAGARAVSSAYKAASVRFSRNSGWYGFRVLWSELLKDVGSTRRAGEASSLVQACVLWVQRTFPEAPLQVQRVLDDGTIQADRKNKMARLIRRPNTFYSGQLLWWGTLADWILDGNAYWLKVRSDGRNGVGSQVVELWWAPAHMMEPRWPDDGSEFISHYDYSPNGVPERWEVEDVVHFRYGLDGESRKGVSPLKSVLLELVTDQEAARFTAAMLKNLGVPGVILAPNDPREAPTPEDAEAIKAMYQQKFTGDKRGEPMVMETPISVSVLSFNPQQMQLDLMRDVPEERVSAVLGIPAVVVGFGAGLERATFTNFKEARESAYEGNIIPSQRLFAEELGTQLLPDFGDPDDYEVSFDLDKVRILQTDQNELHARARDDLKSGLTTLNQSLQMIGLPQEEGGNIRYIPANLLPTPVGEEVPEPEPVPEPLRLVPPPEELVGAAAQQAAEAAAARIEASFSARMGALEERVRDDAAAAAERTNEVAAALAQLDRAASSLLAAKATNGHAPRRERRTVERDDDGLIRVVTVERESV